MVQHDLKRKPLGVDPHSFQPWFFSKTSCFPRVLGGFLERRMPGKNGEGTNSKLQVSKCRAPKTGRISKPSGLAKVRVYGVESSSMHQYHGFWDEVVVTRTQEGRN